MGLLDSYYLHFHTAEPALLILTSLCSRLSTFEKAFLLSFYYLLNIITSRCLSPRNRSVALLHLRVWLMAIERWMATFIFSL
jgi:hypothetical protein